MNTPYLSQLFELEKTGLLSTEQREALSHYLANNPQAAAWWQAQQLGRAPSQFQIKSWLDPLVHGLVALTITGAVCLAIWSSRELWPWETPEFLSDLELKNVLALSDSVPLISENSEVPIVPPLVEATPSSGLAPSKQPSAEACGVQVTVDRVEILDASNIDRHLRLHLLVFNSNQSVVKLPVMRLAVVDNLGNSFRADPSEGTWPESFIPETVTHGSIEIGPVSNAAASLTASIDHIFGLLGCWEAIVLKDILLPQGLETTVPGHINDPLEGNNILSAETCGVQLIFDNVEVRRRVTGGSLLRIHMTVNNRTSDSIVLPIFGFFTAKDNLGRIYTADPFDSDWPNNFKPFMPGTRTSGSADLESPIPEDAATLTIGFSTIFGSLGCVGKELYIEGIPLSQFGSPA